MEEKETARRLMELVLVVAGRPRQAAARCSRRRRRAAARPLGQPRKGVDRVHSVGSTDGSTTGSVHVSRSSSGACVGAPWRCGGPAPASQDWRGASGGRCTQPLREEQEEEERETGARRRR